MSKYQWRAHSPTTVRPEFVERELAILRHGSWVPRRGIRNWGFMSLEDRSKFLDEVPSAKAGWL
jgi:hypothetical protein